MPKISRFVIPVDAARRKFLVSFGLCYIGIGVSYMTADRAAPVRVALRWMHIDLWILGLVWVLCGVIAIGSSFVPTTRDKPGFLCLSIPPSLWALSYAVATLFSWFGHYHAPRAWVSVMVFGLIAFAVDTVSGMVDARLADHHLALAVK